MYRSQSPHSLLWIHVGGQVIFIGFWLVVDDDGMDLDSLTEEDLLAAAGPDSAKIHKVLKDNFNFDR